MSTYKAEDLNAAADLVSQMYGHYVPHTVRYEIAKGVLSLIDKCLTDIERHRVDAEADRCARAYGWEIGRGTSIGWTIDTSPDNPFLDSNWKVTHGVDENSPSEIPESEGTEQTHHFYDSRDREHIHVRKEWADASRKRRHVKTMDTSMCPTCAGSSFVDPEWRMTHGVDGASEGSDSPTR